MRPPRVRAGTTTRPFGERQKMSDGASTIGFQGDAIWAQERVVDGIRFQHVECTAAELERCVQLAADQLWYYSPGCGGVDWSVA
ncbi:unnamed protein product, partial [Mesorhabditis spiculigera]